MEVDILDNLFGPEADTVETYPESEPIVAKPARHLLPRVIEVVAAAECL